jgi:uncharacterized protein YndB with AHSA1/START domain
MGPKQYETKIHEFEARDGGRWSFTHLADDGTDHRFRGVFHGDPSVDGITQTWEYLGYPGVVAIETMRFEVLGDGRTRMHGLSVYPSVEARDGMVASGMEGGVNEGYERLDDLLSAGTV